MKKYLIIPAVIFALAMIPACKKAQGPEADKDSSIAKKYAKYRVAVSKNIEGTTWLATLEKAESVDLLGEETYSDPKKKTARVMAKVKLSDDTEGYVDAQHLADQPIVFIGTDVKTYVRNNAASQVYTTIPQGTIGFVVERKADWVQVYVGKVGSLYVTQQWVNGGYSTDPEVIEQAKQLEEALAILSGENKKGKREDAIAKLREVADKNSSPLAGYAQQLLSKHTDGPSAPEASDTASGSEPAQ